MKIKYLYIFLFILLTSLSSCGYKLVNQPGGESYFINKFEVSGEKRLGHSIKNEILLGSSNVSFINFRNETASLPSIIL